MKRSLQEDDVQHFVYLPKDLSMFGHDVTSCLAQVARWALSQLCSRIAVFPPMLWMYVVVVLVGHWVAAVVYCLLGGRYRGRSSRLIQCQG